MNYNNGCLRKIVVACSVRNPTDSTTKYTKNLKCSKEVTVLQKRAENRHCDTKDLKELLTMSRRKRNKPG
jgi:hypothetical protein